MTLTDLASLGSFVSGVAVLVSLVFVYFQMRQMTEQMRQTDKNQRAAIGMGRATRATNLFGTMIDPAVTGVLAKAVNGHTLNDEEAYVYFFFCAGLLTNLEDSFVHHRAGLLDKTVWESEEAVMRRNFSQASFRAMWPLVRGLYGEDFRRCVEDIIGQVPVFQPGSLAPIYNAAVGDHLAQAIPFALEGPQSGLAPGGGES
jgi:hypothetical protein